MLNFNSVLVFSENPAELAEFYAKVFQAKPGWTEGEYSGWKVGSSMIMVGPHDKVHGEAADPNRIMLNYETPDVAGEFARIKELGAKVVAEPYHPGESPEMWLATFADPDGNIFQLASPTNFE
ncbi:VOC family protein [Candidatus Microgenomates bacterium]|nr:VOC family protein [Candidatus Microgenomates bacterium]